MTVTARPYVIPKAPKSLPVPNIVGTDAQPVSGLEWVHRDTLRANDYNPNRHATPELVLLAISILEDGWTQPIVTRTDGEIVDGFHRWTVSSWEPIFRMTEGLVPVVGLAETTDPAQQRMATIRHNRARGSHYIVSMADLLAELIRDHDIDAGEAGRRLGMDPEEVRRLLERGEMTRRGAAAEFNTAWAPKEKAKDE